MTSELDKFDRFSAEERAAVYRAISKRRDIRRFYPDAVPPDTLARILRAGYHAPSVGFSQPSNFIVVRDLEVRRKLQRHVEQERLIGAGRFEGERRERYLKLKLEGILTSPLNLCVTCDRERFGPAVLGRNTIREADIYSSVTAVQNMWLAARSEGVGMGWVSILRNGFLQELLGLPSNVVPIAYMCVGYPREFSDRRTLETAGWLPRVPLQELVFEDQWSQSVSASLAAAMEQTE